MTSVDSTMPEERRGATRSLIESLLEERQRMLVLYERLGGVEPYPAKAPETETLREFSQILIDYIAAGHFGLYERIAKGQERRRRVVETARELYPRIVETTEAAVAFNDAYERVGKQGLSDEFSERLSALGEQIAARIELEDRIIEEMTAR